jgi:hypothetical protein
MTKLNWHKYPEEKPVTTRYDGIIVVFLNGLGATFLEAFGYDRESDTFFNHDWIIDSESKDNTVIAWMYLDELPLPELLIK